MGGDPLLWDGGGNVRVKILILNPFLTSQYFCVYEILQFCKFWGFLQKQFTPEKQNQNMIPEILVYFAVKSLSFAKMDPREMTATPSFAKINTSKHIAE